VFKSSLEEEMRRATGKPNWNRPETEDKEDEDEEFLKAILEGEKDDSEIGESRPSDMPSIRAIVLERLKEAGADGSKAAAIREYIETTYAAEIHVKTVGMTLYRLIKDHQARRVGRVWYFVDPQTEVNTSPADPI
jgi:hypothetical protein